MMTTCDDGNADDESNSASLVRQSRSKSWLKLLADKATMNHDDIAWLALAAVVNRWPLYFEKVTRRLTVQTMSFQTVAHIRRCSLRIGSATFQMLAYRRGMPVFEHTPS